MQAVRQHLNKRVERLTPKPAASVSDSTFWNDGEPPAPPLSLSIALRNKMADAEAIHDSIDFANFINFAELPQMPFFRNNQTSWKRVQRSSAFTLLKRENEVLAQVRLDASIEEVASVLGATTDLLHAATMEGLYDNSFIAGSVAYVERPESFETDQALQHVAVKTSNFVHSKLLGKNEQWCFGETLRSKPEGDSFTITQISLEAHQSQLLPARLALDDKKRRVAQLRDVSAAYLVERLPESQKLRITFHALHNPREPQMSDEDNAPVLARRAVKSRLLRLARGTSELSQVVRRRRFGVQVFADHSAFHVRNPRCTCCTHKFAPFLKIMPRTRCYLCGYYVCISCASSEKIETYTGQVASINVCVRCVKSVISCNYEHMLSVRPGPERVFADDASTPRSVCTVDTSSTAASDFSGFLDSPSSQKLGSFLTQVVTDDSTEVSMGQRRAAFMVLEQLLLLDQEEAQNQADKNAQLLHAASDRQPTEAARQALDVSKCPKELEACQFASATARPYPMMPAVVLDDEKNNEAVPIVYPIPANENDRLAAIEHYGLHDIANVAELNVICTLAAAEMNCPHSVVTLVEREVVTLLATNAPDYWDIGSGNPREQTFCQHFVMDDKPLLVRHAEADMRFYHIAPVTMRSLRFYSGFPLSVPCVSKTAGKHERIVVGALCCLDEDPHEMTRSQYWRLMKLADAASNILEKTAREFAADPVNHPITLTRAKMQDFQGTRVPPVTC